MTIRLALLLLAAMTATAFADDFSVTPKKTLIGKPVTLRLNITLKEGETARMPQSIPAPEGVEIESANETGQVKNQDGSTTRSVVYRLVAYTLGAVTIPKFEYVIVSDDGKEERREAGPVSFMVESVRKDPATANEIKDIRPPEEIGLRWTAYMVPALLALAIIVALALLWRWFGKRKAGVIAAVAPPVPPRPAHEIAFEQLARLRAEDPFGKGRFQEHFFRLSNIIRAYIEDRYGMLALERTTPEIENELDERYTTSQTKERIVNFLKVCDLVKFAKRKPTAQQAEDALERAINIVDTTREKDLEPAP